VKTPLLLVAGLLAFACDGGAGGPAADGPDAGPTRDGGPDPRPDGGPEDPDDAAGQARLFGGREIVPVAIEIDDAGMVVLRNDPRSDWIPARITVDGKDFPRVGLKLKGGRGSFRGIDQKAAFKIDLDRFDDDANLYGLRKLTFNNMIQDPTKMRERLASLAFADFGLPAARVGYAEITVNGQPYGLYAHVETLDEVFLKRHFPDGDHGNLYEGADDQDLVMRFLDAFDQDAGEDESRDDLRHLIETLNAATPATFEEQVGAVVDLDQIRRFFAAEILTGHWDGYAQLRNNYYVYRRSDTGRFVFLPWGTDQAWQRTTDAFRGPGRLFRLCADWAVCRVPYAEVVRELADRLEGYDWASEIAALDALTEEAFERDRRTPTKAQQRLDGITKLEEFLAAHPQRIRDSLRCLDPSQDADGDGTLACAGDCDDGDATVYPGANDGCDDDRDEDCSGFTDDGPECPPCRSVRSPDGAEFLLCHRLERYTVAVELCEAHGALLASFRDEAEHAFVRDAAFARRRASWYIGLTDRAEEGEFAWDDGADVDFSRWAPGEPNNQGGLEDCVALRPDGDDGAWNDLYCGSYLPSICRVP
jgi:hypothetical protein